jgi:hypothetical protein
MHTAKVRGRTPAVAATTRGNGGPPKRAPDRAVGPLDLNAHPPRPARETLLGFYLLPRTIDKLRAELPGGNIGPYLNHATGFSAFVVKRLGIDMDDFRDVVARARDEADVCNWLEARVDSAAAPALNAKLDSFVVERMSPEDQVLVRERHPVMAVQPELSAILDIIDADDRHALR